MKNFLFFLSTILILAGLQSCQKEFGEKTITYDRAIPVYKSESEFRDLKLNNPPQEVSSPGKIFVGAENIFIVDKEKGIHIMDNKDFNNPTALGFIELPGVTDFIIDGNQLIANAYIDLIALDISNINDVKLTNRSMNVLEARSLPESLSRYHNDKILVGFDVQEVTETIPENSSVYSYLQNGRDVIYYNQLNEIIPQEQIPVSFVGSSNTQSTTNRMAKHGDDVFVILVDDILRFDSQLALKSRESESSWFRWANNETIYADFNRLYIGKDREMEYFKINENSLESLGTFWHARACDPVLPLDETKAFVSTRGGGTCGEARDEVILVSTSSSSSTFQSTIDRISLDEPYGMILNNGNLWVAQGKSGLSILDYSNEKLTLMKRLDIEAYDVLTHPTNSSHILIANDNTLEQYLIDERYNLTKVSTIKF